MNFLIFRDFSRIFLNLFKLNFELKKGFYTSRADVMERCHVTAYVCVCAFARVRL